MTDERAEPRGGSSSQCAARKAQDDGFPSEYRFDLRPVQRVRVLKYGENPCHYFELCVLWLRMYLCMCLRRPRQGCEEKRTSLIARKENVGKYYWQRRGNSAPILFSRCFVSHSCPPYHVALLTLFSPRTGRARQRDRRKRLLLEKASLTLAFFHGQGPHLPLDLPPDLSFAVSCPPSPPSSPSSNTSPPG